MKVTCACGVKFDARNPRAKFCSDRCRKRAQRGGEVVALPMPTREVPPAEPDMGGVERPTRAALTDV